MARNIVASKKYQFLIFVRLDLVILENYVRMQNLKVKPRGNRDYDEQTNLCLTNRLNLV